MIFFNLAERLIKILIYSHLWFALACISLSVYIARTFDIQWDYQIGLLMIFAICLGFSFDHFIDTKFQPSDTNRTQSFYNKLWIFSTLTISFIGLLTTLLMSPIGAKTTVLVCLFITVLYGTPIIPAYVNKTIKLIRLKEIPYSKSIIVASTMSYGILGLTLSYSGNGINIFSFWSMFVFLFILFFSTTVTCDIRDINSDKEHGVGTFPVIFGVEKTKLYLQILNVFSILIFSTVLNLNVIPVITTLIGTTLYIYLSGEKINSINDDFYYYDIVFFMPMLVSLLIQ
jgi:4-hydroxybenzoate polyprenyltransferase